MTNLASASDINTILDFEDYTLDDAAGSSLVLTVVAFDL